MSDADRMDSRPWGEIRLPTEAEVKKGLLNTIVKSKNDLLLSEFGATTFILIREIQTELPKILEIKAGLLAELKKITDYETLLQRLGSYFTEMTEVINNLVSEIKKNQQIGLEAAEELIKEIQNLLCLDPEKDGDLINKLKAELAELAELPKLAKLIQNLYQLEKPLNLVPRGQSTLISDEGNKLEQFKRRVEEVLERNDYEELKGLVQEISDELKRSVNYQAILILDGGNKLEQFKRRVEEALKLNDYEELKGLVQKISALEIMQVYPDKSSSLPPERKAYELKAEYQSMIEEVQGKLEKLRSST